MAVKLMIRAGEPYLFFWLKKSYLFMCMVYIRNQREDQAFLLLQLKMHFAYSNCYGPHQHPSFLLPGEFVCRTENGNAEDVYQLGVILLQLITGKPMASQNELEVLKHQVNNKLLPLFSHHCS